MRTKHESACRRPTASRWLRRRFVALVLLGGVVSVGGSAQAAGPTVDLLFAFNSHAATDAYIGDTHAEREAWVDGFVTYFQKAITDSGADVTVRSAGLHRLTGSKFDQTDPKALAWHLVHDPATQDARLDAGADLVVGLTGPKYGNRCGWSYGPHWGSWTPGISAATAFSMSAVACGRWGVAHEIGHSFDLWHQHGFCGGHQGGLRTFMADQSWACVYKIPRFSNPQTVWKHYGVDVTLGSGSQRNGPKLAEKAVLVARARTREDWSEEVLLPWVPVGKPTRNATVYLQLRNLSDRRATIRIEGWTSKGEVRRPTAVILDPRAAHGIDIAELAAGGGGQLRLRAGKTTYVSRKLGAPDGDWRLRLTSGAPFAVQVMGLLGDLLSVIHDHDGRIGASDAVAEASYLVDDSPTPGSGRLVLVNPNPTPAKVWLRGMDRSGFTREVQWPIGAGESLRIGAREFEDRLGAPGGQSWRAVLTYYEGGIDHPFSLLAYQNTQGHLTNTTSMLSSGWHRPYRVLVPWIAGSGRDYDTYVMVRNATGAAIRVEVRAFDEDGDEAPRIAWFDVEGERSAAFNRYELEQGSGVVNRGLGATAKDWQLVLTASGPFDVGAYETRAARLAPVHARAAYRAGRHRIPTLNHGSNAWAPGFVRLVNMSDEARPVTIRSWSGHGGEGGFVSRTLAPRQTLTRTAKQLQDEGFGIGGGKWWVDVEAAADVAVLAFTGTLRGLSNVSRAAFSGPASAVKWPGAR